jgi:hypothetical protein
MMRPAKLVQRFLLPSFVISLIYVFRFRAMVSPRAKVEVSPRPEVELSPLLTRSSRRTPWFQRVCRRTR